MSEVMAIKASGATIGSRYSPKSEIASILIDGNPRVTSIQRQTRKSKTPRPKIQYFFVIGNAVVLEIHSGHVGLPYVVGLNQA